MREQYPNSVYAFLASESIGERYIPQKSTIQVVEKNNIDNFPNPFNPVTTIKYQLPQVGHVKMQVFDITGRLITTLIDEVKLTGDYSTTWDGYNLSSGVYFVRFAIPDNDHKLIFDKTLKMQLIK